MPYKGCDESTANSRTMAEMQTVVIWCHTSVQYAWFKLGNNSTKSQDKFIYERPWKKKRSQNVDFAPKWLTWCLFRHWLLTLFLWVDSWQTCLPNCVLVGKRHGFGGLIFPKYSREQGSLELTFKMVASSQNDWTSVISGAWMLEIFWWVDWLMIDVPTKMYVATRVEFSKTTQGRERFLEMTFKTVSKQDGWFPESFQTQLLVAFMWVYSR